MKSKLLLLSSILLTVLLLTACQKKDVKTSALFFKGESKNWEAQLRVNSRQDFSKKDNKIGYNSHQEIELNIKYKGKLQDISSLKELTYICEYKGGKLTETIPNPNTLVITNKSTSDNTDVISEKDTIKLTMKPDNNIETVELTAGK